MRDTENRNTVKCKTKILKMTEIKKTKKKMKKKEIMK